MDDMFSDGAADEDSAHKHWPILDAPSKSQECVVRNVNETGNGVCVNKKQFESPTPTKGSLHVQFQHQDNEASTDTEEYGPRPREPPNAGDVVSPSLSLASHSSSSSPSSSSSSSSEEVSSLEKFVESRPPDGGWGWVVVAASFLVNLIADGITFSFGVIFKDFLRYFNEGQSKTAWIGSLFASMPLLSGPLASFVTDRYGCRCVTIAGAILAASGFILSSFVNSVELLFVTFGILAGFGLSLCYVAAVVIVAYYFDTKRSFATGLSVCGSGIGTFVFAPLTQHLLEEYGWRGTTLILAGLFLNMCVCGALMRDLEWTSRSREERARKLKEGRGARKRNRARKNKVTANSIKSSADSMSDVEQLRKLLQNGGVPSLQLDDNSTAGPDAASRMCSSLVNLPTFVRNKEKVPAEVLELLSTNNQLYSILQHNYPSLLSSRSFSDSGLLNDLVHQHQKDSQPPKKTLAVLNDGKNQSQLKKDNGIQKKNIAVFDNLQNKTKSKINNCLNLKPGLILDFEEEKGEFNNFQENVLGKDVEESNISRTAVKHNYNHLNGKSNGYVITDPACESLINIDGNEESKEDILKNTDGELNGTIVKMDTTELANGNVLSNGSVDLNGIKVITNSNFNSLNAKTQDFDDVDQANDELSQHHHPRKLAASFLRDLRVHRHSLTYRGAMLNINRYRLRASSCPDIYRNSMSTIAKENDKWYSGLWELWYVLADMLDFSHFMDIRFLLFAISNFLLYSWYDVPYFYLPLNAVELGFSETDSSFLVSIMGILNMVGEIFLGWMGDRPWVNSSLVYAGCMAGCGVVTALFPLLKSFKQLSFASGVFGLFIAANYSLTSIILVELITIERFTNAYGLLLLVQGIANLVGPPIGGLLHDINGTYDMCFYIAGSFIAVSGILLLVLPSLEKYRSFQRKRFRNSDSQIAA